MLKKIPLFLVVILLSGCFGPVKTPEIGRYEINTVPENVPHATRHAATIMVIKPTAKSVYHTTAMIYSVKPFETSTYAVNEWSRTPPDMLQPLIVQTLQKTGYFHAVLTPPIMGNYTYSLDTQIYSFLQDYTTVPGVFRLTVHAQIVAVASNRILSAKVFTVIVPIAHESPYEGVLAANAATRIMLQQLAKYTLATVGSRSTKQGNTYVK